MLMPKRVKYRKIQRGSVFGHGIECRATEINFGEYGLQSLEAAWITSRQIEAVRLTISRFFKHGGKMYWRIFPHKSVTKKPAETRMGKGKGDLDHWVAPIRPGRMLVELEGLSYEEAKEALRLASHKFPVKTKFRARSES